MDHSLSHAREMTGCAGSVELVMATTALDDQAMGRLAERLVNDPPMPTIHPPRDELWPIVTARSSLFVTNEGRDFRNAPGAAGLNLTAAFDPRQVGTGRFSGSVLRALLYAHGLVIEDPLVMAADMYLSTSNELRHVARVGIESALTNMVEIEPLLDHNIVETYFPPSITKAAGAVIAEHIEQRLADAEEDFGSDDVWETFEAGFVEGLNPHLQRLWRMVRAGNRSPDLDLVRSAAREVDPDLVSTFVDVLAELRPGAVVANAVHVAAQAIADATYLGGRHDFLAQSPLAARLVALGCSGRSEPARLLELARTDVPRLDDLSMNDIVAIRQASETLERWRYHLALALERGHQLRASGGSDCEVGTAVGRAMAEAREQVLGDSGRSDLPRRKRRGLITFTAGVFGGAVGGATGGTEGIVAGAAGGGLGGLLSSLGERWTMTPGFVRRHYVVFEPRRSVQDRA